MSFSWKYALYTLCYIGICFLFGGLIYMYAEWARANGGPLVFFVPFVIVIVLIAGFIGGNEEPGKKK